MRLEKVIKSALDARMGEVHTSFPATVVSFSAGPPATATVRPIAANTRKTGEGQLTTERLPDLPACPVMFPSGTGHPLQAGDEVVVVVAERSVAEWSAGGGSETEPRDPRRFDLSDALVIPNSQLTDSDIATAVSAGHRVLAAIGSGEVRLGSATTSSPVALSPAVAANFAAVATLLGELVTWVEDTIAAGSLEPDPGFTAYTPTSTAATKVMAE